MEYRSLLSDFASRTMVNLEAIENLAKQGDAFEVTQLVNSFLGLFVFAQQSDSMPVSIAMGDAMLGDDEFQKFRNAVTHFHIEQTVDDGEVVGLKLWNVNRSGNRNWERNFRVNELRSLVSAMHGHLAGH
jgi:hypothetical protein